MKFLISYLKDIYDSLSYCERHNFFHVFYNIDSKNVQVKNKAVIQSLEIQLDFMSEKFKGMK